MTLGPRHVAFYLSLLTFFFPAGVRAQAVTNFAIGDSNRQPLMDVSGQPVANPLRDNQTILLNQLASPAFSILAQTSGELSKVVFYLTNLATHTQIATSTSLSAPFVFCPGGNCAPAIVAESNSCGTPYLLQAVPYSATGVAGTLYSAAFTIAPGGGITITQDPAGEHFTVRLPSPTDTELKINDAAISAISAPVILDKTAIKDGVVELNTQQSGLVQGVTYYFQSLPSGTQTACTIQPQKWNLLLPEPDYLSQGWAKEGRLIMQYNAGMTFREGAWSVPTPDNWDYGPKNLSDRSTAANFQVGQQAEDVSMAVEQGVREAAGHHDIQMIEELAQFYLQFYNATEQITLPGDSQPTTLGSRIMSLGQMDAVAQHRALGLSTDKLNHSSVSVAWAKTTKTIPTVSTGMLPGGVLTECPLCNEIFLSPAATLIRLISEVPVDNRKPDMKNFVAAYAPFLVNDQVLRLTYNNQMPLGSCADVLTQTNPRLANPASSFQIWAYHVAHGIPKQLSPASLECYAMFNNDLYLIGMAAELLGANANDPALVPLTSCPDPNHAGSPLTDCQLQSLHNAVSTGVALFQLKAHIHPAKDFAGHDATGVSYFDGDQAALPEHAHACHSSADYPVSPCKPPGSPSNAVPLVSWDVSHYAMVPTFLRTLYDNKKILGGSPATNFPQASDLRLAANQLVYNVLRDATQASARQRPVFSNFMDGTDGWYRVGYHGANSGASPSAFCDSQNAGRTQFTPGGPWLCVASPGITTGWGLLALFNPDLNELEQNFAFLAQNYQTNHGFLDKHYFYIYPFSFFDADHNVAYPPALENILFLNAAQIQ